MWNTEEKMGTGKMVLAEGSCVQLQRKEHKEGKLSRKMAMMLGALVTLEIMVAGAMVLNIDFLTVDIIALLFSFVVLYFGVVAVLTDK